MSGATRSFAHRLNCIHSLFVKPLYTFPNRTLQAPSLLHGIRWSVQSYLGDAAYMRSKLRRQEIQSMLALQTTSRLAENRIDTQYISAIHHTNWNTYCLYMLFSATLQMIHVHHLFSRPAPGHGMYSWNACPCKAKEDLNTWHIGAMHALLKSDGTTGLNPANVEKPLCTWCRH